MSGQSDEERFAEARQRMSRLDLKGRGITDTAVLRAMGEIRREKFVLAEYYSQAYADGPLPIGMGQTISQPFIVALMTQELCVKKDCEVLEIGTGSGYQAAILSVLAKKVYTIDRFGELSEQAQGVLGQLGIDNVEFLVGDGSCGWPEERIFDRIMITAAVPQIPEPLVEQLKDGGHLVVPVGGSWVQKLMVCKKSEGKLSQRTVCDVRFVKLIGRYGFER